MDTRSIVPYTPYLLEFWDGHLNVEVCTSIKAVKYLYKYTYKGPDRACVEHARDEIADFLDARYVGAPEAAWRLLEFELHGRSHQVERLPVHLPMQQTIQFQTGLERQYVERALSRRTKLEAWFDLTAHAATFPAATADLIRRLRYPEIPQHFKWDSSSCSWQLRQRRGRRGEIIARMRYVKPSAGELYDLRSLLLHASGASASSWDSIRSSCLDNGVPSFQQKARDLSLLHDDQESVAMLTEAARVVTTTAKICELFAETIVWLDVQDKPALWAIFLRVFGRLSFCAATLIPL